MKIDLKNIKFYIMINKVIAFLTFLVISLSTKAQTIIVNPDGTHTVVIDNGNIKTIINPNGTHSTVIDNGHIKTIVNPNGTHATLINNGPIKTIVNSNGTHTTVIDNDITKTIVNLNGMHSVIVSDGNFTSSLTFLQSWFLYYVVFVLWN